MNYKSSYMDIDQLIQSIQSGTMTQQVRAESEGLVPRPKKENKPKPNPLAGLVDYTATMRKDAEEFVSTAPEKSPYPVLREHFDQKNPAFYATKGFNVASVGRRLMEDLQRDFKLTPEQAAGFVGNLDHETGGFKFLQEIKPVVAGSRGGYGYAHWTGPRRKAFEGWAAEKGLDLTSYEANYGFFKHELENTSEGRVLNNLSSAKSADEAAELVSKEFFRPGKPHLDSRKARANRYLSNFLKEREGK